MIKNGTVQKRHVDSVLVHIRIFPGHQGPGLQDEVHADMGTFRSENMVFFTGI